MFQYLTFRHCEKRYSFIAQHFESIPSNLNLLLHLRLFRKIRNLNLQLHLRLFRKTRNLNLLLNLRLFRKMTLNLRLFTETISQIPELVAQVEVI